MVESEILIELKENYTEMNKLIEEQNFKIKDAEYFMKKHFNVIRKFEQLVESRDKWKMKYQKLRKNHDRI